MASWVARRAQIDRNRREAAQKSAIVWEQLRALVQKNVAEFNGLYHDTPDRQAECLENGTAVVVRLRSRPEAYTELRWNPTAASLGHTLAYRGSSALAAESLIFGSWDRFYEFRAEIDESGAPRFVSNGAVFAPQEVAEKVLAPVLFPK